MKRLGVREKKWGGARLSVLGSRQEERRLPRKGGEARHLGGVSLRNTPQPSEPQP